MDTFCRQTLTMFGCQKSDTQKTFQVRRVTYLVVTAEGSCSSDAVFMVINGLPTCYREKDFCFAPPEAKKSVCNLVNDLLDHKKQNRGCTHRNMSLFLPKKAKERMCPNASLVFLLADARS